MKHPLQVSGPKPVRSQIKWPIWNVCNHPKSKICLLQNNTTQWLDYGLAKHRKALIRHYTLPRDLANYYKDYQLIDLQANNINSIKAKF